MRAAPALSKYLRGTVRLSCLTLDACAAELMKVGNVLLVSNAKVNVFQGTPRLALDRSGTVQLAAEGTEVEPQARAAAAQQRAATRH